MYEKKAKQTVAAFEAKVNDYLKARFPSAVKDPNKVENTPENAYLAKNIERVLRGGYEKTASALIAEIYPGFMNIFPTVFLSFSRMTKILIEMSSEGVLKRSSKDHKDYFSYIGGTSKLCFAVDKYHEDTRYASKPIPDAPSMKEIFGE